MKLSTRLQTIFDMVPSGCVVADIGCDHGLLPIALVKTGKCSHAYACDVRKGPLSRAQQAIQAYGLQDQISTILCDGLQGIGEDVDVVVIAGMGYDTICRILQKSIEKSEHYKHILLQCNSHVEDLRRWLHEHGFCIDAEQIVKDHHYYQILRVHKEPCEMSEEQYLFGVYLDTHPLFQEYWTHILHKKRSIVEKLQPYHDNYAKTCDMIRNIEAKLKSIS